jgi:hypothetical protein
MSANYSNEPQERKVTVEELGWIELEPSSSIEELLKRKYRYLIPPEVLNKKPTVTRKVRRRIVLYDAGGEEYAEQMHKQMLENGDRPAGLEDAIEINYLFPSSEKYCHLYFVFLDEESMCNDKDGVLCVIMLVWLIHHALMLCPSSRLWPENTRFVAIREEQYLDS